MDSHSSNNRVRDSMTTGKPLFDVEFAADLTSVSKQTVALNELTHEACETLRINRPHWNVIEGDVSKIDFSGYRGKTDVVSGGFPCQAFSYAGNKAGFEDARGTLFFEFAHVIKETRPKMFIGENVRGLLAARIYTVRDALKKGELYPCDVPQSDGQKYPKRKAEILAMVPPGGYWRDLPLAVQKEYMKKSFYLPGGKTGMARRLSWDAPSLTLTCAPAQNQTERCHPEENRPLTIREYARIQTFPDEWKFVGSIAEQYRQIGNAVPVNLAYAIGLSVVDALNRLPADSDAAGDSCPVGADFLKTNAHRNKPTRQLRLAI